MASQKTLVLITGATGYIGGHIVQQALDAGYPVRITARAAKVDQAKEYYGDKVEVVAIDDITTCDYTDTLKGVGAVIHVASPMGGVSTAEGFVNGAVNGVLNLLKHVLTSGVRKVVVTSSIATVLNADEPTAIYSDRTFSAQDWNPATEEQALDGTRNTMWAYMAAKTLAEREVWKFAEEHPEVDVTTIIPPFVYGPFPANYKPKGADFASMSSVSNFYMNVLPTKPTKLPALPGIALPLVADVRDIAKAHVVALEAPPSSQVGQKRLIVAGESYTWKDVVEYLQVARPDLKDRLPDPSEAQKITIAKLDTTRAKEVLGLSEYIDWKKTVDDTVDSLLALEKSWAT